ncbi:sporulation sigma factor SigE [Bacillus sp. SG-1]|nr:sporulation sigma factor SigE [Bacillus sp. SG-1]
MDANFFWEPFDMNVIIFRNILLFSRKMSKGIIQFTVSFVGGQACLGTVSSFSLFGLFGILAGT